MGYCFWNGISTCVLHAEVAECRAESLNVQKRNIKAELVAKLIILNSSFELRPYNYNVIDLYRYI